MDYDGSTRPYRKNRNYWTRMSKATKVGKLSQPVPITVIKDPPARRFRELNAIIRQQRCEVEKKQKILARGIVYNMHRKQLNAITAWVGFLLNSVTVTNITSVFRFSL